MDSVGCSIIENPELKSTRRLWGFNISMLKTLYSKSRYNQSHACLCVRPQVGDLWLTDKCTESCTCNPGGEVRCEDHSCNSNSLCDLDKNGNRYCRPTGEFERLQTLINKQSNKSDCGFWPWILPFPTIVRVQSVQHLWGSSLPNIRWLQASLPRFRHLWTCSGSQPVELPDAPGGERKER